MGLKDNITFRGSLLNVPKVLCYTDVFMIPSEIESFGLAALEAMSCKIPVIASTAGGLPEVVKDGETGFIVEGQNPSQIAEAIEKLLFNKSLREQLGKNGRKRVMEDYNFSDNVNQMVEIYNRF